MLFLNIKVAFWVAIGIPISFSAGFFVLWFFGQSLNMISIFALMLVLGIVVDDAIVVSENISYHRKHCESGITAAIKGSIEMSWPVIASTATTIAAFIPMFFVSGTLGQFMREIPLVVIAVLIASLLECLFILPFHLCYTEKKQDTIFTKLRFKLDTMIDGFIDKIYKPLHYKSLEYPIVVITIMLVGTIFVFGLIQGGFVKYLPFPKLDNEVLEAKAVFPSGSSMKYFVNAINTLEESAKKLNAKLGYTKTPLIKKIYSRIIQEEGIEGIRVIIEIMKSDIRKHHSQYILDMWRKETKALVEAISIDFVSHNQKESKPIQIKLLSKNFTSLLQISAYCKNELSKYKSVFNIEDDYLLGQLQISPVLKEEGRLLGLSEKEIGNHLFKGFAGQEALQIQRKGEAMKVRVRYKRKQRESIANLQTSKIIAPGGERLALSFVTNLTITQNPARINRESRRRRLIVSADVDEKNVSTYIIKESIEKNFFLT